MTVEQPAARVYLLWGDDTLTRDELVRSFKSRMLARPGGELNLIEFRAPDIDARELIAACDTMPFLDDRRLVIVYSLFGWRPRTGARRRAEASEDTKSEGPTPLKDERELFLSYLPDLAPQTTLVLSEPTLSPPQRAELIGRLPPERSDIRAFPAPQGFELERWLGRRARQRGGELGPRVASLLREHGPGSLEALDQEIAKLVAYAGDEPVSMADLEELLPGSEIVVFGLLDAVSEGRTGDALSALRALYQQGLRPEELAPQVIALYRRLLVCLLAVGERVDPAVIQRQHGVKLIDKLKGQARRFSQERLELALEQLLHFDRRLKIGEVEPESGLELLIRELSELPSTKAAAH